ncbi:hypothetical protein [Streptococcus hyovaginalis]|uniref:hypothetical protein n=1 Tax=Streptococcus hyovaginalis TaxID=149015 RepID=UPI003B3A93F6
MWKRIKKKRRLLLISLFVLLGMIILNLDMNSPYYAIHSKDTSQDEVPGVIVDHYHYYLYQHIQVIHRIKQIMNLLESIMLRQMIMIMSYIIYAHCQVNCNKFIDS